MNGAEAETINITEEYKAYSKKKIVIGCILLVILFLISIYSLSIGGYKLSLTQIYHALTGHGDEATNLIIWNIRLPRIVAAIVAGISLAVSGAVMQCTLRNPLASPYTIGISYGAMFGAAFAIIFFNVGGAESTGRIFVNSPYVVTVFAFMGALTAVLVILLLAKLRKLTPGAIILAGIAMGSLFSAGTMLMQYFANDLQLAAFLGIIGFVGLICPHAVRIFIGGDYRYVIPISALFGAILLLVSDTVARTMISPIVLPVGILTSFMGAPVFLYLLVKMYKE